MTSITLYGAEGSGSIAVEAALTLLGIRYELIEGATWVEELARDRAYEFAFFFAPLRLKGATGSPGNPLAIR